MLFQKRIINEDKLDRFIKKEVKIPISFKIEEFFKWYATYRIEGKSSETSEYQTIEELKKFIEKMAIWYELRYPDKLVESKINGKEQINTELDKVALEQKVFTFGITSKDIKDIEEKFQKCKYRSYFYNGILDCVMYQIIERGGSRIGPRRAFLFAKEFNRNIEIPMIYGIDKSDPYLRNFVEEYINSGGSKELNCYINYFSVKNEDKILEIVTIDEILSKWPKFIDGGINEYDGYSGEPIWKQRENFSVYYDEYLYSQCLIPIRNIEEVRKELDLENFYEQAELDYDSKIQKKIL